MKTVTLLPVRTADGRLRFASYIDESERQKILDWARDKGAKVGAEAQSIISPLQRLA